eukprot:scaffold4305_cov74-Phaeocystis_antarctica.AAC.1
MVRWLLALTAGAARLRGVWHAAGVLSDALLARQTAATLARVYGPKAHGAWALQRCTAALPLEAFAFFSSVAALLGGAGQANYAAANSCLDALAGARRGAALAGVSVQPCGMEQESTRPLSIQPSRASPSTRPLQAI